MICNISPFAIPLNLSVKSYQYFLSLCVVYFDHFAYCAFTSKWKGVSNPKFFSETGPGAPAVFNCVSL